MKKRILTLTFVLLLFALLVLPAAAAKEHALVVDEAGVLTQSELDELLELADSVSSAHKCDVAAVLVDSLDGKSAQAYADDYYDYNGYGWGSDDDGILLLIAVGDRQWAFTTYGYGITAFTDCGLEELYSRFSARLSEEEWALALTRYYKACDDLLTQADNGEPYDVVDTRSKKDGFDAGPTVGIGAVLGFLLAGLPMGRLKREVKNVSAQSGAADYVRPGSFNLAYSQDRFLYSHVDRVRKQESSNGGGSTLHTSSSGRSHGGSSGSF